VGSTPPSVIGSVLFSTSANGGNDDEYDESEDDDDDDGIDETDGYGRAACVPQRERAASPARAARGNPYARAIPFSVGSSGGGGASGTGGVTLTTTVAADTGSVTVTGAGRTPFTQRFAGLVLASRLGLFHHPGLVARHMPAQRTCALCPCCKRHRRLTHASHAAWAPDPTDKQLCQMPAALVEREHKRNPFSSACRASARDVEVLNESDFSAMLAQIALQSLVKCTCDGGGDVCRYIGAPPGHRAAQRAAARTPSPSSVASPWAFDAGGTDPLAALNGL